ncbi:uncharacterized protein LOC143257294 isoform X2 [Tachypleus tridentatus]|uniref:uncharacterized protein LOC143257294 isoform X2 n=1 Tax=Tachypleus tridentatus TaxID=6853 RepID=UPI003FD32B91
MQIIVLMFFKTGLIKTTENSNNYVSRLSVEMGIVTLFLSGLLSVSSTSRIKRWDYVDVISGGSGGQRGNSRRDWTWQKGGGWKHGWVKYPNTSFKCSHQLYMPGYYADVETHCKGIKQPIF